MMRGNDEIIRAEASAAIVELKDIAGGDGFDYVRQSANDAIIKIEASQVDNVNPEAEG